MINYIKVNWHCAFRFHIKGHRTITYSDGVRLFNIIYIPYKIYTFCECGYKCPDKLRHIIKNEFM